MPDSFGGIESTVREIISQTSKFGVNSKILVLSKNNEPECINFENIEIWRAKKITTIASCGIPNLKIVSLYKRLSNWAEIIHFHFPWPVNDLLSIFINSSAKKIVTYHSDIVHQKILFKFYKPLMNVFLNQVDRIIVTSNNYLKSSAILSNYKSKIEIVPIGITKEDYPKISSDSLSGYKKRFGMDFFLFIGRARNYKGIDVLIKAAKTSTSNFILAGKNIPNDFKHSLHNDTKNILLLDEISNEEKVALLKLSKALILPSILRSEAFGVVLLEASMYAKPMITTELGTGTSLVNIHNKTGYVIKPNDCNELINHQTNGS